MLDLGWEHLGVEMDTSNPDTKGIDAVIFACGRGTTLLLNFVVFE